MSNNDLRANGPKDISMPRSRKLSLDECNLLQKYLFVFLSGTPYSVWQFVGAAIILIKFTLTIFYMPKKTWYFVLRSQVYDLYRSCACYICWICVLRHLVVGMISLWSVPNRLVPLKQHHPVVSCVRLFRVPSELSLRAPAALTYITQHYQSTVFPLLLFFLGFSDNRDEPLLQLQTCNDSCGNDRMVKEHLRDWVVFAIYIL